VPVITLTTDFGTKDWFVGTMKGVIASIAPNTRVIDITHETPPGDIRAGAFALAASYNFFPGDTIHVVVVDPGVGSKRKPVAVQTTNYAFVGPDNGVLSLSLANEKIKTIRALENEDYFLRPVSRTFHGRDIFAPVAGHLSRGLPIQKLGPALKDFVRLKWPRPRQSRGSIEGEVVYLDRFGNGITNISGKLLSGLSQASCYIFAPRRCVCPLKDFYQGVPAGKPVAVPGSSGFVEIALNSGSAAERLGLKIGTPVVLRQPRAARGRVKE
jgi:S-adenosylmethionine hydrolase